ncbi:MAG: FHA domain-containing protein, partial [Acidobacteria bacterium]|nr:FHA domain-containing protein [Acidobacteriota bacterium]
MALLHIVDASGRQWQCPLSPQSLCTIGRAPDNTVVLNDPRASRYHAHVKFEGGVYFIVDGRVDGGRSANHVFVGGEQFHEHQFKDGDRVTIGASQLRFEHAEELQPEQDVRYDDKPLGHTQLLVSATDVIRAALANSRTSGPKAATAAAQDQNAELEALRGKAKILAHLYEMSKTLGSVFTLDAIFDKACEVIFDATPADRVVALLKDESAAGDGDDNLKVVAMRVRDEKKAAQGRQQSVG